MISSPNKADVGAPAADGGAADQQTGLAKLETVLIARYGELRQHLTRRLGSQDWADEALQDTYLRLNKTEVAGDLQNPIAYLFRAALNVALNRNRAEKRRLKAAEIEALFHIADDVPDAQRIIEGRADLARLKQIMSKLPMRQRSILLAARLDGLSRPGNCRPLRHFGEFGGERAQAAQGDMR